MPFWPGRVILGYMMAGMFSVPTIFCHMTHPQAAITEGSPILLLLIMILSKGQTELDHQVTFKHFVTTRRSIEELGITICLLYILFRFCIIFIQSSSLYELESLVYFEPIIILCDPKKSQCISVTGMNRNHEKGLFNVCCNCNRKKSKSSNNFSNCFQ